MSAFYARIGDHTVRVELDSDRFVPFFLRSYPLLPRPDRSSDLTLRVSDGYGGPFAGYEVDVREEADATSYLRADYTASLAEGGSAATLRVFDELALKHALMNVYSAYLMKLGWGLLLHASCVSDRGGAHLFAGRSGAGKSTAASLSLPRPVLSDEAALVKIDPDSEEVVVFHSPFRSELESDDPARAGVPLRSVLLLRQAVCNRKAPLSKSDALLRLMELVFCWRRGPEESARALSLLGRLVDRVPAYELHFRKDDSFWELIS